MGFFIALLAYKAVQTNQCRSDLNGGNVSLRLVESQQRAVVALQGRGTKISALDLYVLSIQRCEFVLLF